jgi:hypothetical protein
MTDEQKAQFNLIGQPRAAQQGASAQPQRPGPPASQGGESSASLFNKPVSNGE